MTRFSTSIAPPGLKGDTRRIGLAATALRSAPRRPAAAHRSQRRCRTPARADAAMSLPGASDGAGGSSAFPRGSRVGAIVTLARAMLLRRREPFDNARVAQDEAQLAFHSRV